MAMGDPGICYADIERCREGATVALFASSDGDEWTRIDVGEALDGPGQPDAVLGTSDGRVVVVKEAIGGVRV